MILNMSLTLFYSYVIFSFLRFFFQFIKLSIPPLLLLRFSQILIVVSLLVPVTLSFVPEKKLPPLKLESFIALPEESDAHLLESSLTYSNQNSKNESVIHLFKESEIKINRIFDHLNINLLFMFWLFGFLFFFSRMLFSFFKLKRILNLAIPLKYRGSIRVIISDSISIPFSLRYFKIKWVVLPLQLLDRKNDFHLALKHELQHHRQGDTLWAVFIEFLQCFLYFNPAIYAWKKTIIELQEFSCDEALTGQRGVSAHEYGSCLIRVAETALKNHNVYLGTTCMVAIFKHPNLFKSLLRRRIEMITQEKKSTKKLAGSLMGTITILLTVTLAYGTEQTNRNTTTSVDEEIQKIADKILEKAIIKQEAKAGFAIITDPNTGKILAVSNIDKKDHKIGQWSLSEKIEPASIMKGIIAAEAIEQGATTPASEHNCEKGTYRYGNQTFHDWKTGGWEKLTTTDTIANSSDICALKIAEKLGVEKTRNMLMNYGFGAPKADPQILPSAAYGMGFKSTPIEIIQAYGAIANGGTLLTSTFLKDEKSKIIRRVLSEENSKKMRELLQQVVLSGTAKRSPSKLYSMAGKTASSFSGGVIEGESTGGPQKTDIAGFIGFAPVLNPKVEIYVSIFHPKDKTGAHGSTHAVPVFTELTDAVLQHMKVTPDLK